MQVDGDASCKNNDPLFAPPHKERKQTEFAAPLIPLRTNMLYRRSTPHQSQMLSATTLIAVR
jgi:hypothetical protein